MSKIKGIIFDLDDTLYNEFDYVKSGYRKVSTYLKSLVDKTSEEIFDLLINRFKENRNNVFNYVLDELGIDNNEVLMDCLEVYRKQEPDIELERGTKELLLELKQEYKLGIITDGRPEGQWAKIKALGLNEIIDEIIVTDELGGIEYRKPNELAYLTISKKLELYEECLVYIGDNEKKDFITPKKMGMITIKVENNNGLYKINMEDVQYRAMYAIKNIVMVKQLLEKM